MTRIGIRDDETIDFKRATKAAGVAARIQEFCAESSGMKDDSPKYWDMDEEFQVLIERYAEATLVCSKGASLQILEPHTTHCREYPSQETWDVVRALLLNYIVIAC